MPDVTPSTHPDTKTRAERDAFSKDLHALVARHIEQSNLTPHSAAHVLLCAADSALDHLTWRTNGQRRAVRRIADALQALDS